MKIKIKKLHEDAVIPRYSKDGDAGMDLVAVSTEAFSYKVDDGEGMVIDDIGTRIHFGLAFEIPKGYVGLVFPRSSICKTGALLSNSVGVIDSGYRGEVQAVFYGNPIGYKKGERCAQLIVMPYPQIEFEEAAELSDTERGTGGFGSTGA